LKEKEIIFAARLLSVVFTPFFLPLLGIIILFLLSYLKLYDMKFKLSVIFLVWLFTVILPTLLIRAYRRYHGWTLIQLGARERRMVPYVISILCYFCCLYIMSLLHITYFITSVIVAALIVQIICAIINVWWKISTHTAAIGGVTGALIAFSFLANFNPIWWLCLTLIVAGCVGTSRMILRQHTLPQVVGGFFIGLISAYVTIFF
jgi:membrane-associated phospholipid phosphatase